MRIRLNESIKVGLRCMAREIGKERILNGSFECSSLIDRGYPVIGLVREHLMVRACYFVLLSVQCFRTGGKGWLGCCYLYTFERFVSYTACVPCRAP